MTLSTACGCVSHAEMPDCGISDLARTADKRMYEAKAVYCQNSGRERRRPAPNARL